MQSTPLTERHYYDSAHTTPRWLSDLYCLWRLCPHTACRRAQACRGDGCTCQTGLTLVPNDALDFIARLEDARDDGLSFDEMIDLYAEELAALERWRDQVALSVSRPVARSENPGRPCAPTRSASSRHRPRSRRPVARGVGL